MPKEGFKGEVEHHLTGKETEPWKIIYFKVYKSQLPVVEQALERAALMLGTDKSRGYCLEMVLAGANICEGQSDVLFLSLERLCQMLPEAQRTELLGRLRGES